MAGYWVDRRRGVRRRARRVSDSKPRLRSAACFELSDTKVFLSDKSFFFCTKVLPWYIYVVATDRVFAFRPVELWYGAVSPGGRFRRTAL